MEVVGLTGYIDFETVIISYIITKPFYLLLILRSYYLSCLCKLTRKSFSYNVNLPKWSFKTLKNQLTVQRVVALFQL
jgi:hypothetical protein